MRVFPLSYRTRVVLYQIWRAASAALAASGVAIPGGQSLWEQVALVVLGLGSAGAATVAIAHAEPPRDPEPAYQPRHAADEREGG